MKIGTISATALEAFALAIISAKLDISRSDWSISRRMQAFGQLPQAGGAAQLSRWLHDDWYLGCPAQSGAHTDSEAVWALRYARIISPTSTSIFF